MRKILTVALVLVTMLTLVACGKSQDGLKVVEKFTAQQIGEWGSTQSPNDDSKGTATYDAAGDFTVVRVDGDTWGGIQSPAVTLDLTKQTYVAVQIKEVNDLFKWTLKFVPSDPALEGHEWGLYLVEDNGMKWNKYVMVDVNEQLGEDLIDLYGGKIEGVFWLWAAGAADANVEVRSLTIFQGDF